MSGSDLFCNMCDQRICPSDSSYNKRLGICAECAQLVVAAHYLSHSGNIPDELRSPAVEAFFGRAAKRLIRGYQKAKISQKLRWAVFRRDGYRCAFCGSDDDLTVDHVIPEVAGGTAVLGNLQTLCRPCNSKKCANILEKNAGAA